MARDDYYMGSLAGLDAYRGDEPAWPEAPQPMGAVANPWADYMSRDQPLPTHAPQREPDKYQRLAGGLASLPANAVHSFFGGPAAMMKQNPYPEGSDLAQHFENTRADVPYEYGPATAVGLWGMGPRVKGGLSATGGSEIVQPQPAMAELAKPFYSATEQAVVSSPLTKAPPEQWLGTLRNTPGVKADELERLGLEQYLRQQQGAVPKQTLADYVAANKVDVGEVRKGEPMGLNDAERLDASGGRSKFQQWQLPGGENYRETLLTMPDRTAKYKPEELFQIPPESREGKFYGSHNNDFWFVRAPDNVYQISKSAHPTFEMAKRYVLENKLPAGAGEANFTAGHFSEPNVLAHYRTNDRVIDGKKTLFLEEVQSDWHQKGREQGYRENVPSPRAELDRVNQELNAIDERHPYTGQPFQEYLRSLPREDAVRYETLGARATQLQDDLYRFEARQTKQSDLIPDAPFKTTWHELALKRAIRDAAEGGYDQIAWTPGSVQNQRYQLSNHLNELRYMKNDNGTYEIAGTKKSGDGFNHPEPLTAEQLPNVVGKEMAAKIIGGEGSHARGWPSNIRSLSGIDLEVGGEGMRGFYDKMLPAAANKLGKKHGAQVGQAQMFEPVPERTPGMISRGIEVPATSHTVHTLPITPSLRETALRKGFPLFVTGGVTTMGALASQDRYNQ